MTHYAYTASKLGPYRVDPLAHMGLAKEIARDFSCARLEREDLEQEAFAALCAAARTFDPDRGFKFGTWAGRIVRTHLAGVVYHYRRVGTVGGRNQHRLSRPLREYLDRGGRDFSPGVIRPLLVANNHWRSPSDWECSVAVMVHNFRERSLDVPVSPDDDSPSGLCSLHEAIEDPALLQGVEDRSREGEIERAVSGAMGGLMPREREVVLRRVIPDLVGDREVPTLQEIADEWGMTRQRVQQIEASAIAKLQRVFGA